MAITSAEEASELVREFLRRMGWVTFVSPRNAKRVNSVWVLEFGVGFKNMRFEVDAEAGKVISYETLD